MKANNDQEIMAVIDERIAMLKRRLKVYQAEEKAGADNGMAEYTITRLREVENLRREVMYRRPAELAT
jgi:PII-like signaling protein